MKIDDLRGFYTLLHQLEERLGGYRTLTDATGRLGWPNRGVYFFTEPGEHRSASGVGPRIVRVGTHALKTGGQATLWNRLSQHRGSKRTGGGNQRGSIFRNLIGGSLLEKRGVQLASWDVGMSAPVDVRKMEHDYECQVSLIIRAMPFLWLEVDDEPGPKSMRGHIERNSIALLSNSNDPTDVPSENWLGNWCRHPDVRRSGLWNSNHVHESHDPNFLGHLDRLVDKMTVVH
jgi:hypothetical protein